MVPFQSLRIAAIAVALGFQVSLLATLPALAEDQPPPATKADSKDKADKPAKPKKPFGGGSPIEVIINNKLWTDEPKPQDFVIQNRRPVDELHYQPTVGTDPERPKTLNKDQLNSLQSELEAAQAHNTTAVTGKPPPKPLKTSAVNGKPPPKPLKPKPKTDEKPLQVN
jgi:hypothetical protein